MAILGISCAYIVIWDIVYLFAYTVPVTVQNMNYSVVITGGLTVLMACWWSWKSSHGYQGPAIRSTEIAADVEDAIRIEDI